MTVIEIAAELARNPNVDRVFRSKTRCVGLGRLIVRYERRVVGETRWFNVGGDPWDPNVHDLLADDWEFVDDWDG